MSEKKQRSKRHTMELPVYNVSEQIAYITSLCKELDFDVEQLTSFILADFIFTMENIQVAEHRHLTEAFMSFLSHACQTGNNFKKLKELYDNERK